MTTEKILGAWIQPSGIWITETEYDHDAHAFVVTKDDKYITTIYADTLEEIEDIRTGLNAEEDIREWDDGTGISVDWRLKTRALNHSLVLDKIKAFGTVYIIRDRSGLRETLRKIEDSGTCYHGEISHDCYGTLWVDHERDIYYEYETDNPDVLADDLTDEDLRDVIMGGL